MELEIQHVITIISIVGTSMVAAIGVLWKTVLDFSKKQIEMSNRIGKLEGQQEGIRDLSYNVLRTVDRAIYERSKRDEKEDRD